MPAPALHEMLARLIAIPSVSSVNPLFDQGNRVLIDEIAGWMEAAGFARCEYKNLTGGIVAAHTGYRI